MKINCWKCKGKGRIKNWQESLFFNILTFGVLSVIRSMVETDITDDRYYGDCFVCKGTGYLYEP